MPADLQREPSLAFDAVVQRERWLRAVADRPQSWIPAADWPFPSPLHFGARDGWSIRFEEDGERSPLGPFNTEAEAVACATDDLDIERERVEIVDPHDDGDAEKLRMERNAAEAEVDRR